MNKRFLQRWKYFVAAAFLSAVFAFLGVKFETFWFTPLFCLTWALALFFARKSSFNSESIAFFVVITGVCSFVFFQLDYYSEYDFAGDMALMVIAMGFILGVLSAGAHDRFLSKDHPSLKRSGGIGVVCFLVPYLFIKKFPLPGEINLQAYDAVLYVISWQLILGFLFSRENKDDQANDSKLTDLIKKIGKK